MKIIGIRNWDSDAGMGEVYLMADSSIIKSNKPFFLPYFAQSFTATGALVLRVDRLGKHIAHRFAHRYCGAVAPAVKVTARGIEGVAAGEGGGALGSSFDGALLLGDFASISPEAINDAAVAVSCDATRFAPRSLSAAGIDFRSVIERLSVFYTLKMGDMIVLELGGEELALSQGQTLKSFLNLEPRLTIRVK